MTPTPNEKRKATLAENKRLARINGQRLRRRRIESGLTVERSAEAAGVASHTFREWEVGTRGYPARFIPAIAAALGIPMASLLTDDLVLAEIRLSPETLDRIKREGRPAAIAAIERISANLVALALAEATRPPVDLAPGAWARRRRSREELLAARAAGIAAAEEGRRRRDRKIA